MMGTVEQTIRNHKQKQWELPYWLYKQLSKIQFLYYFLTGSRSKGHSNVKRFEMCG